MAFPSAPRDALPGAPATIVIQPTKGWRGLGLHELWAYRDLVRFLVLRKLKSRHRQTLLGPLWFLVQPVVQMVVFTVVFGGLAKLPSDGVPYALFTFAALVPWAYFAESASSGVGSLADNLSIISKVYFPRLAVPIAAAVAGLFDLAISLGLVLAMGLALGFAPGPAIVAVPMFLALAMLTSLAVGLWLATATVWFRDLRMVVALLLQAWMFATPVAYAASLVPERWLPLFQLNPMYWVVEGMRWSMIGTARPDFAAMMPSVMLVLVALVSGAFVFRRTERTVVDVM